ncbi:hypothetical protein Avbf_00228 [Armadillidium vulgare]|nr:hypothetical protein Avbf_00228 [Armadillidium vulgare]
MWNLQQHMKIHYGEKPFSCPYCSHRTVQKANLRKHIFLVHRKEH